MSQPQPGKIYISVTRNYTFLSLPAQSLFWARSKSIEIPLKWAKLNMHYLPRTWQTPCLPPSLLIMYMHVSLVLCKMPQERKLLQLLSWDCQDGCIPPAMSLETFCWRKDFVVGIRSFWRMMIPLSPGKWWWKNGTFLISWPFWHFCHKQLMHETSSCHSFVTLAHVLNVQNIMHLRSLAEAEASDYIPGLVHVVPGSILVWRYICTIVVVLNICWSYTDSWQLLQCLKAHDPCSRQQEFALMFPVWSSHHCTHSAEPSSRAGGFWLLRHGDLIWTGFSITS